MSGWEDGRTVGTEVVIMRGSERKEIFIFHNENRQYLKLKKKKKERKKTFFRATTINTKRKCIRSLKASGGGKLGVCGGIRKCYFSHF